MDYILNRLKKGNTIGEGVYIADNATVIGDVILADDVSIWHGCVMRGDIDYIKIGRYSNVQDLSMIHVTRDKYPVNIGEYTTIGHGAKLHGCTIGSNVLVGIGAIILDGVVIEDDCIIAAGSLVTPRKHIPKGSMVMGSPAKVVRELTEEEKAWAKGHAEHYVEYKNAYKQFYKQ